VPAVLAGGCLLQPPSKNNAATPIQISRRARRSLFHLSSTVVLGNFSIVILLLSSSEPRFGDAGEQPKPSDFGVNEAPRFIDFTLHSTESPGDKLVIN
jgi:hypothetical protein